jgi:hypothetical protein
MDIRIIINAILLLLILHIILINIDYRIEIGKEKKEHFSQDLHMGKTEQTDDFNQKLLNYIQQVEVQEKEKEKSSPLDIQLDIQPSNTYSSDNNHPNFESDVVNLSKFYDKTFDNLNEVELKNNSHMNEGKNPQFKKAYEKSVQQNEFQNMGGVQSDNKALVLNIPHEGRKSEELPLTWNYKDELPMNGGSMSGIYGFDSLESSFADYSLVQGDMQSEKHMNFKNIPYDDLRKPIVYENYTDQKDK